MQLVRAGNALLHAEPAAAERRLRAPSFGVVPLGARLGLLQWVPGGVPLWGLFRAWQTRLRGACPARITGRSQRVNHLTWNPACMAEQCLQVAKTVELELKLLHATCFENGLLCWEWACSISK